MQGNGPNKKRLCVSLVVNLPGLKAPKRPTQSQVEEGGKWQKRANAESRAPPDKILLLFLSLRPQFCLLQCAARSKSGLLSCLLRRDPPPCHVRHCPVHTLPAWGNTSRLSKSAHTPPEGPYSEPPLSFQLVWLVSELLRVPRLLLPSSDTWPVSGCGAVLQ